MRLTAYLLLVVNPVHIQFLLNQHKQRPQLLRLCLNSSTTLHLLERQQTTVSIFVCMHLIFFFVSFVFSDKELMVGEVLCRWTIQLSASEYFLFMLWLDTELWPSLARPAGTQQLCLQCARDTRATRSWPWPPGAREAPQSDRSTG